MLGYYFCESFFIDSDAQLYILRSEFAKLSTITTIFVNKNIYINLPRPAKESPDQLLGQIICVKEQPVQEYLTDSSGILGQINLETLNNVHAIAPNILKAKKT